MKRRLILMMRRRMYHFRAGFYPKLPKNQSLLKLELVALLLLSLTLLQKISVLLEDKQAIEMESEEKQTAAWQKQEQTADEPEDVVIEFVSGGQLLQEKIEIKLPETAKNAGMENNSGNEMVSNEAMSTGAETGANGTETGMLSGEVDTVVSGTGLVSQFTPLYYPTLTDIIGVKYAKADILNLEYLREHFYIVNATTKMTAADFDVEYFLTKDLRLKNQEEITTGEVSSDNNALLADNLQQTVLDAAPQILIYHTHGSEGFIDSRPGEPEDTVVGVGEVLTQVLREKYGYAVLHETKLFDKKNGKDNRNYAYGDALPYIENLLKEYPSIEVVIDLHRDAGEKRVVILNDKSVAKVMLFNGLCTNKKGEKLLHLPNANLEDNLAFSFQMKLIGDEMYPGLMNRIFLKDYRYNMHLMGRYLLVELGTEKNTVEEAKNAMEPLADVLAQVLGRAGN